MHASELVEIGHTDTLRRTDGLIDRLTIRNRERQRPTDIERDGDRDADKQADRYRQTR